MSFHKKVDKSQLDEDDLFKENLKDIRELSSRYILELEIKNLKLNEIYKILNYSNRQRLAYNELLFKLFKARKEYKKNEIYKIIFQKIIFINNLLKNKIPQNKVLKKWQQEYLNYSINDLKNIKENLNKELKNLTEKFGLNFGACQKMMNCIYKKYKLSSVSAWILANNALKAVDTLKKDNPHFKKRFALLPIQSKIISREILFKLNKNNEIYFKWNNLELKPFIKDEFQQNAINSIIEYLKNPSEIDEKIVDYYLKYNQILNINRPCYAIIIPKFIRNRYRIFIQIMIDGKPSAKLNKNNEIKHQLGVGNVSCDIGTQTIAYSIDKEVGLENLAQRGDDVEVVLNKLELIQQKIDIERRILNPEYFNTDGTIKIFEKRFRRKWKTSEKLKRLKIKLQNLHRKRTINKKIANNELVNKIRSLGNVVITESKNANRLKTIAKIETTFNEKTGKYNRKRRFGRSIQNRALGYLQMKLQQKFQNTGGIYIEVSNNYKASQYDHTTDNYIKKKLDDRYYALYDGTMVQRDMYSAFLLQNFKQENQIIIDKEKCKLNFNNFYQLQNKRIYQIQQNKEKIYNSGIKF